MKMTQVD